MQPMQWYAMLKNAPYSDLSVLDPNRKPKIYTDVHGGAHFGRTDRRMRRSESGSGKASERRLAYLWTKTIGPDLAACSIAHRSHGFMVTVLRVSVRLFNKGNEKHHFPVSEIWELLVLPLNSQVHTFTNSLLVLYIQVRIFVQIFLTLPKLVQFSYPLRLHFPYLH